jgi:hypothetical protein
MTATDPELLIISQRSQPTELHLPDGTVALLEPHGTLLIPASARSSPQLLALERARAVAIRPAPTRGAAPPPPPPSPPEPESRSKSKRTRMK